MNVKVMSPEEVDGLSPEEVIELGIAANTAAIIYLVARGDVRQQPTVKVSWSQLPHPVKLGSSAYDKMIEPLVKKGWQIKTYTFLEGLVFDLEFTKMIPA